MSHRPTGLALYDTAAQDAAGAVIRAYSTSFGMATRLLGRRPRPHVRNIYALVRVADEIVDGPATEAGMSAEAAQQLLDDLEAETSAAIERGFSSNLVVHAFAATARASNITSELIAPFFSSMRTDLSVRDHDDASHAQYVYGSAEVVGLMCLQVFVNAGFSRSGPAPATLVEGARRLGAAFQDVNFLRDLDHDGQALGRDYLGITTGAHDRTAVLDRIDSDLAAAANVIPLLPADCRRAVAAAHDLFASLSRRLRSHPAPTRRVRVPDIVKAGLVARAWLGRLPRNEAS